MHFQRDLLYSVSVREADRFFPVWNQHLVPLPIEDLKVIVRPRTSNPVRILRALMVSGTAGKGDYGIDTYFFREQDRVAEIRIVFGCDFFIGMHRVAVSGERGDLKPVFIYRRLEFVKLLFVRKQLRGVAVSLSGIASGAYFHSLHPKGFETRESFVKRFRAVKICEYTKFHKSDLLPFF